MTPEDAASLQEWFDSALNHLEFGLTIVVKGKGAGPFFRVLTHMLGPAAGGKIREVPWSWVTYPEWMFCDRTPRVAVLTGVPDAPIRELEWSALTDSCNVLVAAPKHSIPTAVEVVHLTLPDELTEALEPFAESLAPEPAPR